MVTSNKLPEKKVVKMTEQNTGAVVPQRTLLGEVNEHITCPLCRGYYIDATTIVECLHSFCRSCIIKHLQVKSYCPVCEMMINSAKPNIKPDKALQDIVYKLVPGLFQREMERRQQFYASRPGPAASATPEQRGEDTERVIFSPEDVISFSLEYTDVSDTDSISSKSSDSSEGQPNSATSRRYLQCPAVVNISHLKKFISMKFDIDSTLFSIDILYKRVPLPDYYTLMDIAYIYNWKRNEPMRFFYHITDYIAIRSRYGLFDINRNGSHFKDTKSSASSVEDTGNNSVCKLSEPETDNVKLETSNLGDSKSKESCDKTTLGNDESSVPKNGKDEDEKSQFLNSFELTAKSSLSPNSGSVKNDSDTKHADKGAKDNNSHSGASIEEDIGLKRKKSPPTPTDTKKIKVELSKETPVTTSEQYPSQVIPKFEPSVSFKTLVKTVNPADNVCNSINTNSPGSVKTTKEIRPLASPAQPIPDFYPLKRPIPNVDSAGIMKPKLPGENLHLNQSNTSKTVSPLKLQIPKPEQSPNSAKKVDIPKQTTKKIPDLKPGIPTMSHSKMSNVGKLRMDLLANNCDPTMDRSKILSQVKTAMSSQSAHPASGENLRSLFHSCKINIPSSLSITLTDQKQEQKNVNEQQPVVDPKKSLLNKKLTSVGNSSTTHKVPSPPVHNYIEILKLPDTDPKKVTNKPESANNKLLPSKNEPVKTSNKTEPSTSKGPVPSLKPISDAKLPKTGNVVSPITFQQTFEQQLQTEKSKPPKNKSQVPKLMPATPKAISAANKLNSAKTNLLPENKLPVKSDNALDLSNPHNIPNQLYPQHSKKLEPNPRMFVNPSVSPYLPRPFPPDRTREATTIRGHDFGGRWEYTQTMGHLANKINLDSPKVSVGSKPTISPTPSVSGVTSSSSTYTEQPSNQGNRAPSPRQTRSPSSSPKLIIAE